MIDGGRKSQEKRERSQRQAETTRRNASRPKVKESGETLERRRAGASSIVTRDRRESCGEAAVPKMIQVVDSQSDEVVITVPTVGFNDARTRVPSCGTCEARTRPDL